MNCYNTDIMGILGKEQPNIDPVSSEVLPAGEILVGDRFSHSTENYELPPEMEAQIAAAGPLTEFQNGQIRTELIVRASRVLFGRMDDEIRQRV